jgi:hypothetical protein
MLILLTIQGKINGMMLYINLMEKLGWTYTIKKKKLQNYINVSHKTANHHHHLHVQDYEPDFKEIKQ